MFLTDVVYSNYYKTNNPRKFGKTKLVYRYESNAGIELFLWNLSNPIYRIYWYRRNVYCCNTNTAICLKRQKYKTYAGVELHQRREKIKAEQAIDQQQQTEVIN